MPYSDPSKGLFSLAAAWAHPLVLDFAMQCPAPAAGDQPANSCSAPRTGVLFSPLLFAFIQAKNRWGIGIQSWDILERPAPCLCVVFVLHGCIVEFMQATHAKGAPGLGPAKSIPVLGDASVLVRARTHVFFPQKVESYAYMFFHFWFRDDKQLRCSFSFLFFQWEIQW